MSLEHKPVASQVQKLSLTPELKQSLLILQLPAPELHTYLTQQVIENCFLEYEINDTLADYPEQIPSDPGRIPDDDGLVNSHSLDGEWEDVRARYQANESLTTGFQIDIASQSSPLSGFGETSLRDFLRLQFHLTAPNPRDLLIGEYLIENIGPDGYLWRPPFEVAQVLKVEVTEVEGILQCLQNFEPIGVGSQNIEECLRIQLLAAKKSLNPSENTGLYDLAVHITENFLNEVALGQLGRIAKTLQRPMADVAGAIIIIKQLDPKPGRRFDDSPISIYSYPDIIVKKEEQDFEVEVTEISPANLQVNDYYRRLLNHNGGTDPEMIHFLKERYQAALWLIKCLEQRKISLRKIAAAIVQFQRGFFENGIHDLKPMTLQMISERVGLNESTISRAIQGKNIQTPRGIYPLKYFFTAGIHSRGGETLSSLSVKKLIQVAIQGEDSAAPLSDQQLTGQLKSKGLDISRRTVAKYREEMGIPSSTKRKRFITPVV